ncbi:DUF5682 family protein [Flectobacillus sp. BAB-3569]|uniref:DUF5682 family protein n=1 Tax=Flectobacillus sp. BAB-3569 TaxID=1509483 RepID=UPI000BA2E090|nr:DUF5682 family protein [Flectobacillus sp. BAB-3569]PAC33212.1 hypothetical protein BWI92_01515 [Flectobacillus sp. BAB-3569]
MPLTILGIRHHGVGSTQNVIEMLEQIQPDMVLVEGAPELDSIISWIGNEQLRPPVAVLGYNVDDPQQATFYPFAEFSPEWQAILYANQRQIPVRMLDLPLAIGFQQKKNEKENETIEEADSEEKEPVAPPPIHKDPIAYFAEIAGYDNSELWWEHHFEHNYISNNAKEHFDAVMLMMSELRQANIPSVLDEENIAREAYMREIIRKAQNELYSNIVVVCGAWHAPALLDVNTTAKADTKLLKSLPKTKIKVATTWIPWTNQRLSMHSGYGAGITSPGWYDFLWEKGNNPDFAIEWLSHVARLFRKRQVDISTAHVIEAFRLAETLTSLRGLSRIGLLELNEATQTVMCMGDTILLSLVKDKLIVANRLGEIPDELPKVPLQLDFEKLAKSNRLALTAEKKEYELDLRKELDLSRSKMIHRLDILEINWGQKVYARSKGTFKEAWTLAWKPEMYLSLIDKAVWGNTLEDACTKYLIDTSQKSQNIGKIADNIQKAIPAELFVAIEFLLNKIDEVAAISADILDLMTALKPMVEVSRYGNVRKTDLGAIRLIVDSLLTRICIGLPNTCFGLDDDNSRKVFGHIQQVNEATKLIENDELTQLWFDTLKKLLNKDGVHGIIQGCTCRLLLDAQVITIKETAERFAWALSQGQEPNFSAGWLEGFLKGSGMILIYDHVLWNLLYKWVAELPQEYFTELLPILRRTFSHFIPNERKQLGEKAKVGTMIQSQDFTTINKNFNHQLAEGVLPMLDTLLGITRL